MIAYGLMRPATRGAHSASSGKNVSTLLDATLARSPQAVELLRDHLTRTRDFVAGVFTTNPA